MIGWVIFGIYLLGYVLCWRTIVWFLAVDFNGYGRMDGESIFFGIFAGSFLTGLWPVIASGIAIRRIYAWRGEDFTLALAPRREKRRLELDERERRIRSLERELGIKEHVA
jgi:hypothetical protein